MNKGESAPKGILGIENRTENWKTVTHFYGLDDNAKLRLANQLLKPYGGNPCLSSNEQVVLEMFWYGMRDFIDQSQEDKKPTKKVLAELYEELFPSIQEKMRRNFPRLRANYAVTTPKDKERLFENLRSTEVDIVLTTSEYLFIGEAKHESDLGANGEYILVHQFIREFVMVKMLAKLVADARNEPRKKVIPFLIEGKIPLKNKHQVGFMLEQGWFKEGNILPWTRIAALAKRDLEPHQ